MVTSVSRLDTIYRSILLSRFFVKGWGDPNNMKRIFDFRKIISNRDSCRTLVSPNHPIYIDQKIEENAHYKVYEGHFTSPLVKYLEELIPKESQNCYFQLVVPTRWPHHNFRPICVQLAGTGDHGFWRRRNFMAKPLIRDYQIGSIILENPFYGLRKPKNQSLSQLNNVSDIFIMGGCLILESLAMFHWLERCGYGPLCVTGISMGGHMASLAATNWHKPIGVVPCLSWTTASCVFTQGVMANAIPWQTLETQFTNYNNQHRSDFQKYLVNSASFENYVTQKNDDEMFDAGRNFARSSLHLNQFFTGLNINLSEYFEKMFFFKSKTNLNRFFSKTKPIETMNKRDTFNFMRGIMDECTHLANFSSLVDPELAIIINARHDAYVPSDGVTPLTEIWRGSTVRYLNRGHVSAILLDNKEFRKAIADSLKLIVAKYYNENFSEQIQSNAI